MGQTQTVRVALIGTGKIALANHVPGLRLQPAARLVALVDANPAALHEASRQTGVTDVHDDYRALLSRDDVDAVIVATPNHTHEPIVQTALQAGKHVLCEKPLALDLAGAMRLLRSAESAGVRHMTAFTYRFVPAMRYAAHLVRDGFVGQPYHFRAQRFQDWGTRAMRWRQVKALAGSGELGDMLSHRIDYAHLLVGSIRRLVADMKTVHAVRGGDPLDVDDWVALLAEFHIDATGVMESTKLATGRGENHRGQDVVEINGSDGTIVYSTQRPLELMIGRPGDVDLHKVDVPREFRVWPGSLRNPDEGDPLVTFRYDQDAEFINAILEGRECRPSFREGVAVQAVMEAVQISAAERRWVDVEQIA